jgi:hypothetical protein
MIFDPPIPVFFKDPGSKIFDILLYFTFKKYDSITDVIRGYYITLSNFIQENNL